MRIATFNVNSIHARLAFFLQWLEERKPDIACLQELKLTSDEFPYDPVRAAGYHALVHGQKSWNGVAILSREPCELVQMGLPGAEDAGARLITARIGDVTATSVYVPNGKSIVHADFAMKLAFLAKLRDHLQETVDRRARVVVAGDFNVVHTDLDSYDPERQRDTLFHTEPERRSIDALVDLGLSDLYRELSPDGRMFSWWDYRAGCFHKNQGLRIDLLLATRRLREQTREVWIDRDYRKKKDGQIPSDHAPVVADFD
jgi:exodeoxyribonuclease-3